jgi:two-component system, chemotaxis family, response regulator PixG
MNIANSMLLQQLQFCSDRGFTGKLCVTNFHGNSLAEVSGECWYFIFCRGRLVGNTGGIHPIRRMKRQFHTQGVELLSSIETALVQAIKTPELVYWLLEELPARYGIERGKTLKIIEGGLAEALFDVLRCEVLKEKDDRTLSYMIEPYSFADNFLPVVPINLKVLWSQVADSLKDWKKQGLMSWCPHLAPQIIDYVKLQEVLPAGTYNSVVNLLDGSQTLRDIAIEMAEEISIIGSIFLDYHQQKVIDLHSIADLEINDEDLVMNTIEQFLGLESSGHTKPPVVAHLCTFEPNIRMVYTAAKQANCSYVQVSDFAQSLVTCLRKAPAVMLVDGNTAADGYELCDRLYATGKFKNIPILLLGGQGSLVGRMRGAIGSSIEYYPGSLNQKKVVEVLQKHLVR